ncbi:hypothetical protein LIER_20133 [Lithospermum erythrorhizon]|uniref:Uncharacterized protein n=1 Tax=Lithospermum erythrorhizon TaxID=34254 RepID=A0AAV3QNE1_LITER
MKDLGEAHYILGIKIYLSKAEKEAWWSEKFMYEVGVLPSFEGPFELQSDNTGAIANAGAIPNVKEPRAYHKSKYIVRRYHLIREMNHDEHASNLGLRQMS